LEDSANSLKSRSRCRICGAPYYARGLCKSCYNTEYYSKHNTRVNKNWARKYSKCIKCKSTRYRHVGHGLCTACYIKKKYKTKIKYQPRTRWARYFDCCERCGTTSTKHRSSGLCLTCYQSTKRQPKLNFLKITKTMPQVLPS